jgi:NADH-quinone oxidoreductase subunit N
MPLNLTLPEVVAVLPLLTVTLTAMLVMLMGALKPQSTTGACVLSGLGFAAAGLMAAAEPVGVQSTEIFGGMLKAGNFVDYFVMLFCLAGFLSVLLSHTYVRSKGLAAGEFYSLLLFSSAGMMLMAAAADLVIFFLGLEVMSVSFYVLAAFARSRPTSNEAGLKYFLLGAFATGFLLYGIALVYGATGTTALEGMGIRASASPRMPLFVVGLGLVIVGLMFKVAAVPFHMWVPDVYEGSPTPVSGFMSTAGKAAAFAGFLIVFAPPLTAAAPQLRPVLGIIAALSMVAGNVIAIAQSNIKRMLAYSSIAHAGYILVGIVAGNPAGNYGVLYYLLSYALMNIGAFGVVALLESGEREIAIDDCTGLSRRAPALSALMSIFMFSLTGIPPFAGFFGKYYVFAGAVQAGYTWLAIVGVLMSAVSAYFYLRLVVVMYFREQPEGIVAQPQPLGMAALALSAAGVIGFGVFPSVLLQYAVHCF